MNTISQEFFSFARYPFLPLLIALGMGIMLQSCLTALTPLYWLFLLCATVMIALLIHLRKSAGNYAGPIRMLSLLLSFLLLGGALSSLQDIRQRRDWYGHYLSQSDALTVTIADLPQQKENSIRLTVTVTGVHCRGYWINTKGPVQLYVFKGKGLPAFRQGQVLLIPSRLVPLKPSGNPYAFDYARYAARQGLFHQAFLPAAEVRILQQGSGNESWLAAWRRQLQQCLETQVKDSTTRSLIAATVLNERAGLDQNLWKAYSVTGIVHIIAISGMHIALLAAFTLFLLQLLPSPRLKSIKYLVAVTVAWLYVALTGFPPSAVRAAVMFMIGSAGLLLQKDSHPVNIWAATGFLLLCYNPYWLYDTGVQLSFLAVLSILLCYGPIRNWYLPRHRFMRWLWDALAVSIAAQVLVAPLVIYYFHQFPFLGLLANLPAALFSMLLLYGAVCLFLLYITGIPCLWLGKALSLLTTGFNKLIQLLADCTPSRMQQLYIDSFEYWLMMLVIVLLCLFFRYKKNLYFFAGLAGSLLLLADMIAKDQVALRQQRVVVYNTSRNSLADVFHGKQTIPVYTGSESNPKDEAYTLLPARLGFRAMHIIPPSSGQMYLVAGARILFLNNCAQLRQGTGFPVDFLVVSARCAFEPEAWYNVFHPKMIIIDGSLSRRKALQWRERLHAAGARVHWVQEDGAWIFPALP